MSEGGSWLNRIGAHVEDGTFELIDTLIDDDPATPAATERGVLLENGDILVGFSTIRNQAVAGVEAAVRGAATGGRLQAMIGHSLIEGGQYGVHFHGPGEPGWLFMSTSVVRDQTVAALSVNAPFITDLTICCNELSVSSGFALEDMRTQPGTDPIFAGGVEPYGTTLVNGTTFSGVVQGPVSLPPHYRILSEGGAIQF
jgi:hypothetical protein